MTRARGPDRPPPRDIAELRALAAQQPDLAAAARLHAELATLVRRVGGRLTTPRFDVPDALLHARLERRVPLASFGEFPVDWAEVRLLIRQVTDTLRRMDLVDRESADRLQAAGRDGKLADRARAWYEQPATDSDGAGDPDPMWSDVLGWALKPFLMRMADVLMSRMTFDRWRRGRCPVCGAEPDLGALVGGSDIALACTRCHARWSFDGGCAFCEQTGAADMRQFATADRTYRVSRCDRCRRYLKLLDTQAAGRPLLPFLDAVATLPIDAALMRE